MNTGGWIFMLTSVGLVISLASWCTWRVLTGPRPRPGAGGAGSPAADGDEDGTEPAG